MRQLPRITEAVQAGFQIPMRGNEKMDHLVRCALGRVSNPHEG